MDIIKDRPLQKKPGRTSSKDFPFATLAVGEAFFVPEGTVERKKFSVMMNSVGKRLSYCSANAPAKIVKFSWQSGEKDGVKGAFVQRIS